MPYPFSLPTTSALVLSVFLRSDTHPSLVLAATTRREVVRSSLKQHKRLPLQSQASNLSTVLSALDSYVPYLLALDAGLSGRPVSDEEIDVVLEKEIEVEWRPSLASSMAGTELKRIKGKGLDYELCFILTTLAYVNILKARSHLRVLYQSNVSSEARAAAITQATKHLVLANSIHEYIAARTRDSTFPPTATDISNGVQTGLAHLTLAEATLLAISKDDPYPVIVLQDRDKSDKEWMFKAPDIPKVRAHLFARLSLRAAEHAAISHALLCGAATGKSWIADDGLLRYVQNLQRTSRGKACRFFGIDAELGGKTGEAIGWLAGGKKELGYNANEAEGSKVKGIAKLKKEWTDRREDKKIEKGREWGKDAGRVEEGRVIEMLEDKWNKTNNLVSPPL